MSENHSSSSKTAIIVAIIAAIGGIVVALINYYKDAPLPSPDHRYDTPVPDPPKPSSFCEVLTVLVNDAPNDFSNIKQILKTKNDAGDEEWSCKYQISNNPINISYFVEDATSELEIEMYTGVDFLESKEKVKKANHDINACLPLQKGDIKNDTIDDGKLVRFQYYSDKYNIEIRHNTIPNENGKFYDVSIYISKRGIKKSG